MNDISIKQIHPDDLNMAHDYSLKMSKVFLIAAMAIENAKILSNIIEETEQKEEKKRGRPKGSKNKPKSKAKVVRK